jgi:hypothetical protein
MTHDTPEALRGRETRRRRPHPLFYVMVADLAFWIAVLAAAWVIIH